MIHPRLATQHRGYWAAEVVRQDHGALEVPRPTEYLLPQIRKDITLDEFPFVTRGRDNAEWSADALERTIRELGHWEYHFEFSHGLTTRIHASFNDGTVRFHRFRSKLISETLAELLGSDIGDVSVVDLACHCGAFSLDIADRGAGQVLGLELRDKNLRQAAFLRDYYRVPNVTFRKADVMKLEDDVKADVVLCLGLLYHVVDPIGLLEQCYRMARHMVVVDTITHKEPWAGFHLERGKNPESAIEGTRPSELHPTYRGLIGAMEEAGFHDLVELVGTCPEDIELYSSQHRRCLLGFK